MNKKTLTKINEHLKKARSKHPNFANTPTQVVSLSVEELGEFAKEINDENFTNAVEEALDTIAVLIRFIEGDFDYGEKL